MQDKIFIYTSEGKFKVSLNYTKAEFKKEWYNDFVEGDIISEIEYQHPVVENSMIREMTREEMLAAGMEIQLNPGEVIKGNKIILVEKPNVKPYWNWDNKTNAWIYDSQKEKVDYFKKIDEIKAKRLQYGFDYNGHRQRCRDKDIGYMVSCIVALQAANALNKKKSITWYFEDNYGEIYDLTGMMTLFLYGSTFVQSVFDTENHFKTTEIVELTDELFEEKRKEIHKQLVG